MAEKYFAPEDCPKHRYYKYAGKNKDGSNKYITVMFCTSCKKKKGEVSKIRKKKYWTEDKIAMLELAFRYDYNLKEALAFSGISKDSYLHNISKDHETRERLERAKQFPFQKAKKTIFQNLDDPEVAKYFLNKRSKEYKNDMQSLLSINNIQIYLPQREATQAEIIANKIEQISESDETMETSQ